MTEPSTEQMADEDTISGVMNLHIDLSALVARMRYRFMTASRLVVIGLNSTATIDGNAYTLRDTQVVHKFGGSTTWPPEQAQAAWRLGILQNGFRDIAETIGEILEGAYQFLSIWAAMDERVEGRLASEEWNNLVMLAGQRFHKNNLPAKLEHLKRNFHFSISEDTVLQIKSINAVRNCLVHRNGIIGKVEIQQTMTFECGGTQ